MNGWTVSTDFRGQDRPKVVCCSQFYPGLTPSSLALGLGPGEGHGI